MSKRFLVFEAGETIAEEISVAKQTTVDIVYCVNPTTGNDSNNGLTPATPFKTIAKAVEAIYQTQILNANASIITAPGLYDETVVLPAGLVGKGSINLFGATDISGAGNFYIREIYNKLSPVSGITVTVKGFTIDRYSGWYSQENIILGTGNSLLSNLETDIALSPAFSPTEYSYSADAGVAGSIKINATLEDETSILKINGIDAQSGIDVIVDLTPGTNIIAIEISPVKLGAPSQYVLTVQRDS